LHKLSFYRQPKYGRALFSGHPVEPFKN